MIIKEMKNTLPQQGSVSWIGIRPERKAELVELQQVSVSKENGLEGDHFNATKKKRQVTLIQEEHLQTMASILQKDISPRDTRRNIVVKGINLLSLIDQEFQIGSVVLKGTGPCHPCSRMEKTFGAGGYNAMRGHGGITASVVSAGTINVSDSVQLIPKEIPS